MSDFSNGNTSCVMGVVITAIKLKVLLVRNLEGSKDRVGIFYSL